LCFDAVGWASERASVCKKAGSWFVGGDDLVGALHDLQLQLSLPPPSSLAPIKSKMETFRSWLSQVNPSGKMAVKTTETYTLNYDIHKNEQNIAVRYTNKRLSGRWFIDPDATTSSSRIPQCISQTLSQQIFRQIFAPRKFIVVRGCAQLGSGRP